MAFLNINPTNDELSLAYREGMQNVDNSSPTAPLQQPLARCVEQAMTTYFEQLGDEPAKDVYEMVLNEIEAPLLKTVMAYTHDNQTKASEVLGLNRGTLRKKLKQHGLL